MNDEGKRIACPAICELSDNLSFIIPHSSFCSVLVEQPGVLACLSRRRPRVQVPPGTLKRNGTVRKLAKRPRPPLRGGARTLVTAGSTPACATAGLCSSRRPVKPLSKNK